ncbi:hypothetical protein CONLIGDRAFT_647044 [Coniochaeta ligniaria NRRL 30616]|uniref:C2H2-type domain-containing protein n=1 Tax=Coniochaeta ligniaria NRRL 30616 TaxID=1408157 RepID=A0A1J7JAX6_9PEZI|nr:hypothetical protein CONLIGDRAFT_647044 [Coniochaeta ligniaria NRRL 30616]
MYISWAGLVVSMTIPQILPPSPTTHRQTITTTHSTFAASIQLTNEIYQAIIAKSLCRSANDIELMAGTQDSPILIKDDASAAGHPWRCPWSRCNARFPEVLKLHEHVEQVHQTTHVVSRRFLCPSCDAPPAYSKAAHLRHSWVAHGNPSVICPLCKYANTSSYLVLPGPYSIMEHMSSMHAATLHYLEGYLQPMDGKDSWGMSDCLFCPFKASKVDVIRHLREVHNKVSPRLPPKLCTAHDAELIITERSLGYACPFCGAKVQKGYLRRHFGEEHSLEWEGLLSLVKLFPLYTAAPDTVIASDLCPFCPGNWLKVRNKTDPTGLESIRIHILYSHTAELRRYAGGEDATLAEPDHMEVDTEDLSGQGQQSAEFTEQASSIAPQGALPNESLWSSSEASTVQGDGNSSYWQTVL